MGDMAHRSRPTELLERMEKRQKAGGGGVDSNLGGGEEASAFPLLKAGGGGGRSRARGGPTSILQAATQLLDQGLYQPRTRDTQQAYEKLLAFVQHQIGAQPREYLASGADEVLGILKDESRTDNEKKAACEEQLGKINDRRFHDLIEIGKRITDYHDVSEAGGEGAGELLDENIPVVFEEDEDGGDQEEFYVVKDESDNDEDDGVEAGMEATLQASATLAEEGLGGLGGVGTSSTNHAEGGAQQGVVPVAQIDAYWLQRQVSQFIPDDADRARAVAERVLAILQEGDATTCENQLVELLEFGQFDFVRTLMQNRLVIVWVTLYRRAKEGAERQALEEKMRANEALAPVLDQILGVARVKKAGAQQAPSSHKQAQLMAAAAAAADAAKMEVEDEKVPSHWRVARKILDLEALSFDEGGHLMSNKTVTLPQGTVRIPHKGYEEVHIPAPLPPPPEEQPQRVPVASLPEWAHQVFAPVTHLNALQSAVFQKAFFSPDNLLIAAPTGSGKTNTAMLCILHEIGLNRRADGTIDLDAFKIVYIAPMKSLVAEMVLNFGRRLAPLGIQVRELSGDQNLTKQQISDTHIIVTTPEKWDVVTRRGGDRTYTQLVRLIIIDEVHLLHDERGPVLEAVIARSIRQVEESQQLIRLVGLSATLPNYEDVAMLLRVEESGIFHFGNAHRPVPLELTMCGVDAKKAVQRFRMMNEVCYEQVMLRAGKHQVIVFCHSRKETAKTARYIRDQALAQDKLHLFLKDYGASREILAAEAPNVKNADLKGLLPFGFGIHHAGMTREDRSLMESLFDAGHIQLLVSTATLAWGVNLPAHCVVIKGTQVYSPEKGRWVELSGLDVMQMLGRAGRPQFDTKGEGVLITSQPELQYYLSLTNTQLPVESQLISKLPDLLLAETVLGTVTNVDEAVNWLAYTFLYVCMLRSPSLYGIPQDEFKEDPYLERRRADLVHSAATVLHQGGLLNYDRQSGAFQVTDIGRVASYYYVTHKSMVTYNEHLRPTLSDIEVFRLFCLSGEFKNMSVRMEEKGELEKLLERVPIPVKESVDDPTAKVNVLLQAYISRLKLDGFALMSDMVYITQSAGRLVRALFEVALRRGWAQLARTTLELALMVEHRMWRSQTPLRQFKGAVLEDILVRLERRDFPWERLLDLNSQEIGELIRIPSKGKELFRYVHMFPTLRLTAHVQPMTRSTLHVELTLTPDFNWSDKFHGASLGFWIIVEDCDSERVLYHQYFLLKKKFATIEDNDHQVDFTVSLLEPMQPQYFVRVLSDHWLASETVLPISFLNLIPPAKLPPHDEMLDLRPLPVASSLENTSFAALYKGVKYFNPLQTQTFNALYKSDANVLVAASTGSGIEVCGELAILRTFANASAAGKAPKVVYICPMPALCALRKKQWEAKFGVNLEKLVVDLTGDTATDLKLLELGNLIISTPENWDRLSRRWKKRKPVQEVDLFLVDQLHLLGAVQDGHILEVVVSRMRYIASAIERPIRIVGLAASMANARDVGEWIGASKTHTFNFHPTVRPVTLEMHLQGFDNVQFGPRLQSMSRPLTQLIQRTPVDKPVIVFVHDRSHALVVAKDLKIMCDGLAEPQGRFRFASKEDLEQLIGTTVKNSAQRTLLVEYGIATYHENMADAERDLVEKLYMNGLITCVVATQATCWAMPMRAYLVVIAGTESYDGKDHRYVEYAVTDVLQMVGVAGREGVDDRGQCVLYCYAPRKEFYKRYLFESLPVESQLEVHLHNHLNSEIVTRTIQNKQDAVDYITWTFLYRRLSQNPNYYNLTGITHRHLSDYLSQLIEDTIRDLVQTGMIAEEAGDRLNALNPGIIAAYYYVSYVSIDLFMSSLTAKTKMRGLLEVVAAASEFDGIPIRQHEAGKLRKLAAHLPMKLDSLSFTEGRSKINVLIQAHFSRIQLPGELHHDKDYVVVTAHRLMQAIVDITASQGWLQPTLCAQELSQMLVQGMWDNDSHLKQLPHLSDDAIATATKMKVETIFDFQELDDKARGKILQGLQKRQIAEVAACSNRYPEVEVQYAVQNEADLNTADSVNLVVQLEREWDDSQGALGAVTAPLFPKEQAEGWWLVVGEQSTGTLLGIKRVSFAKQAREKLNFMPPAVAGPHTLTIYLMSDSYVGCDQEFQVEINLAQGEQGSDDEDAKPMDETK